MALLERVLFSNLGKSTLAGAITDVATSLSVQAGHGAKFPNPSAGECFLITLRDALGNTERMKCTTRATDTLSNLTRGIDGTVARSWAAGDLVDVRLGKLELDQFVDQAGRQLFAVAGGTGNAITASFNPTFAALVNGAEVRVRAAAANTGAATFAPDGLTAKAVVKENDIALVANDIPGAGYEMHLRYNGSLDKWVLLNPCVRQAANTWPAAQTFGHAVNFAAPVDVASGATTNIGAAASINVRITGTTTITAFDNVAAGITRKVRFAGVLTLTHGANLLLPGGVNIVTAADDTAEFLSLGAGNWICLEFKRAVGLYKPPVLDHGSKSGNYTLQLDEAELHLVEFSATATLTIASRLTNDKATVVVKTNGNTITLAGINNNSPTLTAALSRQDFIGLVKSFGRITAVSTILNQVTA